MTFEKIWSSLCTLGVSLLIGMMLIYLGLSLFSNSKTSYCSLKAVYWSEAVEVSEHRNFAPDSHFIAPSFEDAMKYASMACPNFHK